MPRALVIALGLLYPSCCLGQLTIDKPYYSRLIITEDDEAEVTVTDIVVDTLIMENSSSLLFKVSYLSMVVKHAIIRKNVEWKGNGNVGEGIGGRGTNGVDLKLEVVFHELDRLIIDTHGGAGSNGQRGYDSQYNLNGENGGKGGSGGNIHLRYRCNGFTPLFGKGKDHAIILKYKGGSGGMGGAGGTSSTVDNHGGIKYSGRPGDRGDKGKDGVLTLEEM